MCPPGFLYPPNGPIAAGADKKVRPCIAIGPERAFAGFFLSRRDALKRKYQEPLEDKRITISGKAVEKNGEQWLRLSVEDRGTGIPDDLQQQMFDPFFTTKPEGKGTGLGMWIVYRIVHEHGGEIGVETRPAEFTRFNIDLPTA